MFQYPYTSHREYQNSLTQEIIYKVLFKSKSLLILNVSILSILYATHGFLVSKKILSICCWWFISLSNALVFPDPETSTISIVYGWPVQIMFLYIFSCCFIEVNHSIQFFLLFLLILMTLPCTLFQHLCHNSYYILLLFPLILSL